MYGDHYGLEFLQAIKDDCQYGEYFSYEEYQALKGAETREAFEAFPFIAMDTSSRSATLRFRAPIQRNCRR